MFEELKISLELFLQKEVELLPKGHPPLNNLVTKIPLSWHSVLLSNLPIDQLVEKIWSPIRGYARGSINVLVDYTLDLALVVSPVNAFPPSLYYIFQIVSSDKTYLYGWLAGPPATEQDLIEVEEKLGVQLPSSYKLFSKIHNGFLHEGNKSIGLFPLNDLSLFLASEKLNEESLSISHRSNQLLGFCGDGMGNVQCYDLAKPLDGSDYLTVYWDHESQKIYEPQPFWSFLERFLAKEMGATAQLKY